MTEQCLWKISDVAQYLGIPLSGDHWVFANKYDNQISHPLDKLKAICRRAGIAEATLHGLRHSFGSHLRMAGTSLADIADLMGHKDLATTQIYAKVEQTHLRAIVSRLSPLVLDQVAPKSGPQSVLEDNRKNNLLSISGLGGGFGWETGIRTPIRWSRATRLTIRRSPSPGKRGYFRYLVLEIQD